MGRVKNENLKLGHFLYVKVDEKSGWWSRNKSSVAIFRCALVFLVQKHSMLQRILTGMSV